MTPDEAPAAGDTLREAHAAFAARRWDDAYRLFARAAEETPLAPSELEAQAEAARWSSRFAEVLDALERAEAAYMAASDKLGAARTALRAGVENHWRGSRAVAMGCVLRAASLLEGEAEAPEHGYLEWCFGRGALEVGDFATARAHLETATAIARRQGDGDVEALGKHDLGHIALAEGRIEEGQRLVDEGVALALSGAVGLQAAGTVYCGTIWACRNRGDYQRAAEWTEVSRRWCAREAVSGFPGLCRAHRAEILRLRGDLVAAESEASAAGEELLVANPPMAGFAWRELGDARLRRGDTKGAAEAYRQTIALGTDPQPGLALLRLLEGNPQAARRALEPSMSDEAYFVRTNRPFLLPAWVTILLACGDRDAARSAAAELDALAGKLGTATVQAHAACARGELAFAEERLDDALRDLGQAWRLWCADEMPYEGARARVLLADVHLALGDREAAVLDLEAARTVYERLGAGLDAVRAATRIASLAPADASGAGEGSAGPESRVRETYVFTDIVGSTALVEAIGDEAWGYLRLWHDKALRSCFAEHGGEEIDHAGDGFFVAFAASHGALSCAVAIQRTLAAHRREHGFAPQVRIGVHAAEVSRRGAERSGRGVHEAARIASAASASEILVSCATLRETNGDTACSPPRTLVVKGLSEPIDVVALDWAG